MGQRVPKGPQTLVIFMYVVLTGPVWGSNKTAHSLGALKKLEMLERTEGLAQRDSWSKLNRKT